jgi:dihydroneopterin aldolase
MHDRIFIRGMSFFGKHGVEAVERVNEQEFLLDVDLWCDARAASRSDDLKDAVDYVPIARMVKEVVEQQSFFLIEKLAEVIAENLLCDARLFRVEVTIQKPAALKNGLPGITIVREQSSLALQ